MGIKTLFSFFLLKVDAGKDADRRDANKENDERKHVARVYLPYSEE